MLPVATPLVVCVLGDPAVLDALDRSVKGRDLEGHSINVMSVTADSPLATCHILYVSSVSAAQTTRILASLRGAPVLTISDTDEFARLGGVAQFFVENGRMRFCIYPDPAKRPRLQLSSKLLALAKCPQ